jgi:peptide/nickel transport system ATP-binding protein
VPPVPAGDPAAGAVPANTVPANTVPANTVPANTGPAGPVPVLEARAVTKYFPVGGAARGPAGGRQVLHAVDGVSLSLFPGRTTALVGESGSGKSTLARLLMGLYRPTAGEVVFDGKPVRLRWRGQRRRYTRSVQMVLQDPFASLNPVHSVRYHLTRPLRNHKQAAPDGEAATLRRLLETVQLAPSEEYLEKQPHELSGGQRQRVAIARALAVAPRVLLADEPVSMLDVSIRLGVLNLLTRLRDAEQLAILYVTHDIASARYFADDVAIMYAGELVETGPAEEVTQHPAHPYAKLLLSSAPAPAQRGRAAAVPEKPSDLPDLIRPPAGCRFAGRCPHASEVCHTTSPEWTDLGGGHRVRCHLYLESSEKTRESDPR